MDGGQYLNQKPTSSPRGSSPRGAAMKQNQIQRLLMQVNTIDERLTEAKGLTEAKFTSLDQQMDEIQGFIEEDR